MKVIMFQKSVYRNQQQPILLNKTNSSYRKLEKEMNKPPSDYEQIKKLIETSDTRGAPKGENDLKTFSNKSFKKVDKNVKIIPHKKQK